MCNCNSLKTDLALLITRLAVGGLMLLHGIAKISSGIDGIKGMLSAKELPELLAYGVYVGEIIAPVMLILGILVRPAALILLVNMFFAVMLAHSAQLFSLSSTGGWALDGIGLYLFGSLAILIAGSGRFALPCPLPKFLKGKCSSESSASGDKE